MSNDKFLPDQWYVIDGEIMNRLWQLTTKLCDGSRMSERERDELGQKMQLHLDAAHRLAKKMRLGGER